MLNMCCYFQNGVHCREYININCVYFIYSAAFLLFELCYRMNQRYDVKIANKPDKTIIYNHLSHNYKQHGTYGKQRLRQTSTKVKNFTQVRAVHAQSKRWVKVGQQPSLGNFINMFGRGIIDLKFKCAEYCEKACIIVWSWFLSLMATHWAA